MIRLVTLNLWHGGANGLDCSSWAEGQVAAQTECRFPPALAGLDAFAAAVRDLAALQPDVIVLQEADERQARSQFRDQVSAVAAGAGLPHVAFQSFFTGQQWGVRFPAPKVVYGTVVEEAGRDGIWKLPLPLQLGGFGVAVASRWPLSRIRGKRLGAAWPHLYRDGKFSPYPGFNRAVLAADMRLPDGSSIRVGTTHLELIPDLAERQLEHAWAHTLDRDMPALLAGDFNLETADSKELVRRHPLGGDTNGVPSFPVKSPKRAIDTVITRGLQLNGLASLSLPVSDHCAVVAELSL